MTGKIFISYRRDDAKADARSLYLHLERVFGADRLFIDVDTIPKGVDFAVELEKTLNETGVLLAVIGRSWLDSSDSMGTRRLDNRADYVRREIAHALLQGIPVIPVRVDGARMPQADELPDDIAALAKRQGAVITHENFESDIKGLETDLTRMLGSETKRTPRWRPYAIAGFLVVLALLGAAAAMMRSADRSANTVQSTSQQVQAPAASGGRVETASATPGADPAAIRLNAAIAWEAAQSANTVEGFRDYLRAHPLGDHRKEATDAAIPLLLKRVQTMVERRIATTKRADGTALNFDAVARPRAMAMCIAWRSSSLDILDVPHWGTRWQPNRPIEEVEQMALNNCNAGRAANAPCECQTADRDAVIVTRPPADWIARQLR